MRKPKTLFEVFGVSRRATDERVQRRWRAHVAKALGEDRVSDTVRNAYRVLANSTARRQYRALLEACERKTPILIDPQKAKGIRNFCAVVGISVTRDPEHADWLHFRLPHQDPIEWPSVSRSWLARLLACLKDVLTLRVLAGKPAGAQLLLVLAYIAVLVSAGVATRWLEEVVHEHRLRSLEAEVRVLHARASDAYRGLVSAQMQFAEDFRSIAGVNLDDQAPSHRPHDLDLTLIRHESVRVAWHRIHELEPSPTSFTDPKDLLDSVESRIRVSTFLEADRDLLQELIARISADRMAIDQQRQWLTHIKAMITGDKFEVDSLAVR